MLQPKQLRIIARLSGSTGSLCFVGAVSLHNDLWVAYGSESGQRTLHGRKSTVFNTITRRDIIMGAMAEALVAYAQPLIDETDGSVEEMQRAFTLSSLCYNLALIPDESRERAIDDMKISLKLSDKEFEDFRRSVITPMIQRHQTMFPKTYSPGSSDVANSGPWRRRGPTLESTADENPKTDRYAPCPCDSGLKYKFCCGKKKDL